VIASVLDKAVLHGESIVQRRAIAKAITLLESTRVDHRAQADDLLTTLVFRTGNSSRLRIHVIRSLTTLLFAIGCALICSPSGSIAQTEMGDSVLVAKRSLEINKEAWMFYDKHLRQTLTYVLSVTPRKEQAKLAADVFRQRNEKIEDCVSRARNSESQSIRELRTYRNLKFSCWHHLRAMAIHLDSRHGMVNSSSIQLPKGTFRWMDGLDASHEDPGDLYPMGGSVVFTPQDGGVHVDFEYAGRDGHQCHFASNFQSVEKNVYRNVFDGLDQDQKCELDIRIAPNFLHFSGILTAQSSCSAALGCGFKADLPDAVPLLFPTPGIGRPHQGRKK